MKLILAGNLNSGLSYLSYYNCNKPHVHEISQKTCAFVHQIEKNGNFFYSNRTCMRSHRKLLLLCQIEKKWQSLFTIISSLFPGKQMNVTSFPGIFKLAAPLWSRSFTTKTNCPVCESLSPCEAWTKLGT